VTRAFGAGLVLLGALSLVACDPVHADEVSALGGEARAFPKARCTDLATLHPVPQRRDRPAQRVHRRGHHLRDTLERAGGERGDRDDGRLDRQLLRHDDERGWNFYVKPRDWTPAFPIRTVTIQSGATTATMYSQISWSASCAGCHTSPASESSPGYVFLTLDDGGTPP